MAGRFTCASGVLVALAIIVGAPPAAAQIKVLSATYGGNCRKQGADVSRLLAAVCNGRFRCRYLLDRRVLGDPAPGCRKRYAARWWCAGDPRVRQAATADGGAMVTVTCPRRGQRRAAPTHEGIKVTSATFGANCKETKGNATAHLASACNRTTRCRYIIDRRALGLSARRCRGNFVAEWRCPGSRRLRRGAVGPGAGRGRPLVLRCPQPDPARGSIQVVSALYGSNCKVRDVDKTIHLAAACNGRRRCRYVVDVRMIGGHPAGCSRDYIAEWRCVGSGRVRRIVVPPAAAPRRPITLTCK